MAAAGGEVALRRMRATFGHAAALAAALLVSAACLTSDVPLDASPQVAIDPALLGTWRCLPAHPDSADDPATIVVERKAERVYAITFQAPGEDADHYEAHGATVKGATLLSVRELEKTTKPWVFARYAFLLPSVLQVQVVSDTLMEGVGPTALALREALEKHQADPALYSDFCVCVRAKPRMEEGKE
jgi:hypothetical protein